MTSNGALLVLCAVAGVTLVGCGAPQRTGEIMDASKMANYSGMVTMPAELRSAYFAGPAKDAVLRYCAEPAPDTAAQAALKVATAIEASGKSTSAAEGRGKVTGDVEYAVTVLELAGRTQAVLLTRELAYRVCEAHINGALKVGEAKEMLSNVILVSTELAKAEHANAETKKVDAAAKADAAAAKAALEALEAKAKATQTELADQATKDLLPVNQQIVKQLVAAHTAEHLKCVKEAKSDAARTLCDTVLLANAKKIAEHFK